MAKNTKRQTASSHLTDLFLAAIETQYISEGAAGHPPVVWLYYLHGRRFFCAVPFPGSERKMACTVVAGGLLCRHINLVCRFPISHYDLTWIGLKRILNGQRQSLNNRRRSAGPMDAGRGASQVGVRLCRRR